MDDDRSNCALLRRDLIFVIPTPVIESFSAFKSIGVVFGIIVHHEEDLPPYIYILKVIPLILGSLNSVSNEDDFCIFNRSRFARLTEVGHEILTRLKR